VSSSGVFASTASSSLRVTTLHHIVEQVSVEQAVFVIDGYERPREVCVLRRRGRRRFGGRDADLDVGAGEIIAMVVPGWRLERRDGDVLVLHHGQRFQLGACNVQFLTAIDVARELDHQRYLETILDSLTGVFNRRFVNAHARRVRPPAALLAIDLDWFKRFNDQYGFGIGDRVLQESAARIRACLRWPELVARIGGEEFLVVLPTASHERALERAETIRHAMTAPFEVDGERVQWTISTGVAMLADSFRDALRRADDCLGVAKVQGRNRVVAD